MTAWAFTTGLSTLRLFPLAMAEWHGIRSFRRDGAADRPDAGNSNGGTGQNICKHRAATHCSHQFSPSFECLLRALQKPQHLSGEAARLFAALQLSSNLYPGGSDLCSSRLKSPCRSIGVFIRASQGFFLSTRAQHVGIICMAAFRRFLVAVHVSAPSMRIDCGRQWRSARGFLSGPSVGWQSHVHFWPLFPARQPRKRGRHFG